MEKDELQSALEEAESALEQEENKVLRAQMDLAQAKQEIERRLQEKEEEFENTRKNFARALDSMQASLDGEMKAKEEVNFILKLVSSYLHYEWYRLVLRNSIEIDHGIFFKNEKYVDLCFSKLSKLF